MAGEISERLVDQRLRNRIIEAVETLAGGEAGLQEIGFIGYFEQFYDFIPHRDHGPLPDLSTLTAAEREALADVSRTLDDACDATPKHMSEQAFVAAGWPARIQPVARRVLDLMLARGRFREDVEEVELSGRF